jgi:hypothetical protein
MRFLGKLWICIILLQYVVLTMTYWRCFVYHGTLTMFVAKSLEVQLAPPSVTNGDIQDLYPLSPTIELSKKKKTMFVL